MDDAECSTLSLKDSRVDAERIAGGDKGVCAVQHCARSRVREDWLNSLTLDFRSGAHNDNLSGFGPRSRINRE